MNNNLIIMGKKIYNKVDENSKDLLKLILKFLICENEFNKIINNNININPEELMKKGKNLNLIQKQLTNKTNEYKNLKDIKSLKNRIRIIFIIKLKQINFTQSNYWKIVARTIFPSSYRTQSNNSFIELFDIICKRYLLLESIYNSNGINGLSIIIALNNKIKEKYNIEVFDLIKNNFLGIDTIILITSIYSPISHFTIEKQAELLYNEYNNIQDLKTKK